MAILNHLDVQRRIDRIRSALDQSDLAGAERIERNLYRDTLEAFKREDLPSLAGAALSAGDVIDTWAESHRTVGQR